MIGIRQAATNPLLKSPNTKSFKSINWLLPLFHAMPLYPSFSLDASAWIGEPPCKRSIEMGREEFYGSLEGTNLPGDSFLVLTTDPKPRLRWTAELHERFVDAVTQLGGPDKATPKTIMRAMGVKGLTLYHLKSHLQKYRLAKQAAKEATEILKDVENSPSRNDMQMEQTPPTKQIAEDLDDGCLEAMRAQMEQQKKLHEHLKVQRKLQLRIKAHEKYLQTMMERACSFVALPSDTNTNGATDASSEGYCNIPNKFFTGEEESLGILNGFAMIAECPAESLLTPALVPQDACWNKQFGFIFGGGEGRTWDGEEGTEVTWMPPST